MTGGAAPLRGPRVSHPAPHGIPGLVRDQRLRTPGAVACSDPQRSLTYAELDLLSDATAAAILRATGGRRGAVALRMPRQSDLLVALLGVLKAGCHYVPVDTDEPDSRVAVMMDVVRPLCAVVTAGQEAAAPAGLPVVVVPRHVEGVGAGEEDGDGDGDREPDGAPLLPVAADDPVYALFTSGSTGTPKAVLVGAAALSNRILWMAREFGLDAGDRVLQKTPYTFDVAGWEFFLPLVTGARCVFAPVDAHYDAREIASVISGSQITVCHFVPTMLESYLRLAPVERNTSLRLVFCSGEQLPSALAARFSARLGAELHNLYGPTEAAIDVTHWPVPRDIAPHEPMTIGRPVDNVDLRVLGGDGEPVAEGESGELWIGGVQVALGYVSRPDLTEAAFTVRDGVRWYRTGDLVTVRDGLVRYLGRTDAQLKIRGVRIEPGEVEAVLEAHPAVGRATVVPVPSPDGSGPELVAVAVRVGGEGDAPGRMEPAEAGFGSEDTGSGAADHEILGFVGERLPRTYVPRALCWVDRLPLTSSGKADRRQIAQLATQWWESAALRDADATDPGSADAPTGAAAADRTAADASAPDELARAWWRVLPTAPGARRDDLGFLSLGGHSLAAATLLARIAELHAADIPLAALLRDNVSLAGLRALVAEDVRARSAAGGGAGGGVAYGGAHDGAPAELPSTPVPSSPRTPRDRSPLTPAQEPLWLLNRALADDSGNNVVGALAVSAELTPATLRSALDDVLARHDLLRAAVRVEDGTPHWSYAPHAAGRLVSRQVVGAPDRGTIGGFVAEIARTPVPLDRPPLMTAGLLRGAGESVLAVSLHHLVADQRALELVLADVAFAYTARSAGAAPKWPAEAPSFADFAHGRAATVGSPSWQADLAHWQELLAEAPVRTALPFRLNGPDAPTLAGRRFTAALGAGTSRRIDAVLARDGHTRATYFLACVASVLAAWSGEGTVAIGMPVSRRVRPQEAELAGLVLGTVPLWLAAGEQPDRDALLRHVRDRALDALGHLTPTFQAIVRQLGLPPSPRDNPLFQVWVNDLSRIGPPPAFAGVPARWLDAAPPAALFDLNFYLREGDDGLRLELVCRDGLYDDAVARELLRQAADTATAFADETEVPGLPVPGLAAGVASTAAGATAATEPRSAPTPVPAPVPAPAVLAAIRAAAARRPDAVAVSAEGAGRAGGARTYAQLLADVARTAGALAAAGAGPEDVVELRAGRTADLPAALLGAWAAGAAVAVTDGGLPPAVLDEQRQLLRPAVVLTTGRREPPVPVTDPVPRPLPGVGHVLFTSGTSGRPAAVKVPPEALAATLDWYVRTYGFSAADRVAMVGGLGHDPLLRDILAPLTVGGRVVVPPEDVFSAPDRLFALLRDQRVTVLHATPALLELILAGRPRPHSLQGDGTGGGSGRGPGEAPGGGPGTDRLDDLRLVVSGGAPLTAGLVRELRTVTAARVVNAYGATETPQLASVHEAAAAGASPPAGLPDAAVLPVGTGAGGAELLVLRPDGTPAPVGHAGEIVVRSPHLAAGYLDGSGRTGGFTGGGAFRTGDRGRRDPSGAVVPDGRLDRQVSLDGHRLDPEQVERAALGHPGVHRALARLIPTPAGSALSLSVVARPGGDPLDVGDLRGHLRRHLPRWAVPTELRVVDAFEPGRRPKAAGLHGAIPAPRAPRDASHAEQLAVEIAGLLHSVTGADVPRGENFFDAGLNSMTLVRLHALLSERLATDFPVTAVFEHPNLTALARFLADGPRPIPSREVRYQPQGGEGAHQRRQLRQRIRRDLDRGQA